MTLEELARSRRLYAAKCGACHAPFLPEKYNWARWQTNYLPPMALRSHLNGTERQALERYLLSLARE